MIVRVPTRREPTHPGAVLNNLRALLKAWQEKSKYPWIAKYKYE